MNPICLKCEKDTVKNGFINQIQRWKCKGCGYQFRENMPPQGKPLWMKLESVILYSSGMSLNATAKVLAVSAQAVLDWVRDFARANLVQPPTQATFVVLELDEIACPQRRRGWHFIQKKAKMLDLESV